MPALATLDDHPDDPVPSGAEVGTLAAADGVALRWARFAPLGRPRRGTVLLLQGRAEFLERWFETIRDLQIRGFAVVAFDWRGQGGSQRLARHPRMGHVGDFRGYRRDLEAILREIVPAAPEPLWILAHSTGALVAADAAPLLLGRVRRMVMVAPFFGLGDFGVPEGFARALARVLRGLGLGRSFVPGGTHSVAGMSSVTSTWSYCAMATAMRYGLCGWSCFQCTRRRFLPSSEKVSSLSFLPLLTTW
mgnify:CR=1 FL=1